MISTTEKQMINKIVRSWAGLDKRLDIQRKDEIAINYLRHIVGVDDRTIEDFLKGDLKAGYAIGRRHAGLEDVKDDHEKFWDAVLPVLPEQYTQEEKEMMRVHCPYLGILRFLSFVDPILSEDSQILKDIRVNMHVYK